MEIQAFFHASKESLYDRAIAAGLSVEAAHYFTFAGEIVAVLAVNEQGSVERIVRVNGQPVFAVPAPEAAPVANTHLTEAQRLLVEIDLHKKAIEDYYELLDATLAKVAAEVGLGGYFQADDGTVYKIVKPEGRFVKFRELDFLRTKRAGETRGTLSMKEAEEAAARGLLARD